MAESVQYHIEGNITHYETLEQCGVFDAPELRKIIRKTKQMEYKLQRKNKSKNDYLKYIQYLHRIMNLVKLRSKKSKMNFTADKTVTKAFRDKMDYLYQALLKRFNSDTRIWNSYFKFCKEMKWSYATSQAYVKMLKVHSNKTLGWIEASEHEWKQNKSIDRARKLLLQGMRFNPDSFDLYIAHFKLELRFIKSLNDVAIVDKEKSHKDDIVIANIKEGKLLEIVYEELQDKLTDNPKKFVSLAVCFLIECRNNSYKGQIISRILSDLRSKYHDIELSWDTIALHELEKYSLDPPGTNLSEENVGKVLCLYEEGLSHINTSEMWEYYLETCFKLYKACIPKSELSQSRFKMIVSLMDRCSYLVLSDETYESWINIVSIEAPEKLGEEINRLLSVKPIEALMVAQIDSVAQNDSIQNTKALFEKLSPQIKSVEKGLLFWHKMIKWYTLFFPGMVEEIFEKGLAIRGPLLTEIQKFYLDWMFMMKGESELWDLFNKMKVSSIISLPIFMKMIGLKMKSLNRNDLELKHLFELACQQYGNNSEIWLKYIKYLRSCDDSVGASALYNRALQHLSICHVDEFICQFNLLLSPDVS